MCTELLNILANFSRTHIFNIVIRPIYIPSAFKARANESEEGVLKFVSFSCKCATFNISRLEYYKENICMSLLLLEKNLI